MTGTFARRTTGRTVDDSAYDHPFQWGSKRTGPDLARVGGRYSNDWHVAHLASPRSVVPESIMPAYPFLVNNRIEYGDIEQHLKTLKTVGVPYTDEQVANAKADFEAQAKAKQQNYADAKADVDSAKAKTDEKEKAFLEKQKASQAPAKT